MKKLFILAGATFFLAVSVPAQNFHIIPKSGVTISTVVFAGSEENEIAEDRVGFTAGLGFSIPLGEGAFSLQPELNYIQKGWDYTIYHPRFTELAFINLNYLEIPVLIKASFGKKTKFYINGGPSFAFGLGGNYREIFNAGASYAEDHEVKFGKGSDPEAMYIDNKIDVSLQLGAGILIAGIIMVDARYGYALNNLFDEMEGQEDATSKNKVLQFTLGVPIRLGR